MQKKYHRIFFASITLLIIVEALGAGFTPKALAKFTAPDGGCWCTSYVANYYHLPPTYPHAYKWAGWLQKLGWARTYIPRVGDIEVLQPKVNGANRRYGHVGIIRSVRPLDNIRWVVTLRGAYQQLRHQFKHANCPNVSDWTSIVSIGRSSGVSYFYRVGVGRR